MSTPNYDQIAFDMAFTHLAQQGVKSVDTATGRTCLYRGPGGLSCPVGSLMHDGDYSPRMEGKECAAFIILVAVANKVGGPVDDGLLLAIQHSHDSLTPAWWHRRAAKVATTFNLSTTTIDALDWSACEATA